MTASTAKQSQQDWIQTWSECFCEHDTNQTFPAFLCYDNLFGLMAEAWWVMGSRHRKQSEA